jgi:CheY-like chemotaxis protein
LSLILVVDDDPQVRVLLRSLLEEELGHEVVFAADGQMAAERFAKIDPDLVITDLIMPKMHGVALINHLRGMYPGSTLIAMSAKGQTMLDQALKAGAAAALGKPLKREELIAAINRALGDPWKRTR